MGALYLHSIPPHRSVNEQLGLAHRIHSGIFREVVGMNGYFILEVRLGIFRSYSMPFLRPPDERRPPISTETKSVRLCGVKVIESPLACTAHLLTPTRGYLWDSFYCFILRKPSRERCIYLLIARAAVGRILLFPLLVQVACGEQHNLARVLPPRKASSPKEEAELYVWGGGRLGQVHDPGSSWSGHSSGR